MALEMCPNSSSYEASPLVTAFHSIPHIDINLNQNVTEFENTLDYYETVIIWGCVPILAVLCIFILMSIYFICVCCCCCCQQHEERSKCSKASCGVFVLVLIAVGLACCGVGLWAEFSLDSGVNSATQAAMNANSVVENANSTAQTLDFTQVTTEVDALVEAVMANASEPTPINYTEAISAVTNLRGEVSGLQTAFEEIQRNADIDFSNTLDAVDFVELARHWVVVAYVILSSIILLVMALSVCCGAMCGTPVCMVIALVFLGMYTVTMWIAVGGNLGYLIIAGDICDNPDRLIRENLDASETQLEYYLVCNETCYENPFAQYQMDANQALEVIMTQQGILMAYASGNGLTAVQDSLDVVVATFDTASSAITNLTTLTNCTLLNSEYLQMLDGLCGDGYQFSLILFAMACCLAVLFILILAFGSFYAGLFSKGRTFDDETIVYDFPNDEGPSPWQSYGTQQQRYHNSEPITDSYRMTGGQEPPKYTDLQEETHMNGNA